MSWFNCFKLQETASVPDFKILLYNMGGVRGYKLPTSQVPRWKCQDVEEGAGELHQLDNFYNALNPNDQDALDSTAGGNFLDKIPRECLSIIESKLKVRYSRSRVTDVRGNANATPPSSSQSNSFDLQQIAAALEDKLDIRMN
nr:reverse transcriptase domain-containing protein [Tanacetum cinerariifolium]